MSFMDAIVQAVDAHESLSPPGVGPQREPTWTGSRKPQAASPPLEAAWGTPSKERA